jgi:hypothetical protein
LSFIRVSAARWVDGWWGYDVFIAHRRADAAQYALALYDKLRAEKISCFIDRVVYGPGDSLLLATHQHVTKSSLFLLVGSPELLKLRKPIDWVEEEIRTYLNSHRENAKVLLVDFGMVIANALAEAGGAAASSHSILKQLAPFIWVSQDAQAVAGPPSEVILAAIRRNLMGRRRDRTRLMFFQGVACILAVLLVAAVGLGLMAERQHRQAIAESYGNAAYSYSESDPTLSLRLGQLSAGYGSTATAQMAMLRAFNSGSWMYSERLDESDDAELSEDGGRMAWVDNNSTLHVRELSSKIEKSWKISTGDFRLASSGNVALISGNSVATWRYRDAEELGTVTLWSGDGAALSILSGGFVRVTFCSPDILVARELVDKGERVRVIDVRSNTADTVVVGASSPGEYAFSPLACTPDGKLIASVGIFELTIIRSGQVKKIATPSGYRIADIQISDDARQIAAFLRGGIDAAGIHDVSTGQWSVVVPLEETHGEVGGLIRFLDDNRIVAASTRGWIRIVDIGTQTAKSLPDKRRAVDQISVHRPTGNFAVARRSGSVTIYDKTGFPAARLVSTAPSDALNSNFDVVRFSGKGDLLLTAARNGVRLWHRPEHALIDLNSPAAVEQAPEAFKQAFGSIGPGGESGIEPCSKSQNMIIDDAGRLSLCVRIYGRDELLPTGLSTDEFSPSIVTRMSKDLDFATWSGDDHSRIFVLNVNRISDYVRSQQIWSPDPSQLSLLTK